MLLRRITKHVKDQNWFAVALDFFIVVVGILIAFRITEWSEARSDAIAEQALLERLHEEVSQSQAIDAATSEYYFDNRLKNLLSARHVVFDLKDRKELTDAECQAIGFSHYPLIGVGGTIPVLTELMSTGEITLIGDETIVDEISKLTDWFDSVRTAIESNRPKITLLSQAFPEMLSIGLKPNSVTTSEFEVDPYDVFYTCEASAMRASAAFRNAFGENVTLQRNLLEATVLPARQTLSDLHDALDQALGEAHEH